MMKRKTVIAGVIVALVMAAGTTALAGAPEKRIACLQSQNNKNFIDADGDGVCDNRGTDKCGKRFVDADGDGICDNKAIQKREKRFVDADGDGICDNRKNQSGLGRRCGKCR